MTACSQKLAGPPSRNTPAPTTARVGAAVQQQVKNGCMNELEAQASGASQPGVLHPQKAKLLRVAFLGDIKQVELPKEATGYELGLEFSFALGHDDPRTLKKLCTINLADSSVTWKLIN